MRLLSLGTGLTKTRAAANATSPWLPVPQNVVANLASAVAPFPIDVSWDDPNTPGLEYIVRWRSNAYPQYQQLRFASPTDSGGRLSVSFAGQYAGADFEVQVASVDGAVMSVWSAPAYVSTPTPPNMPSLDYSKASNSAKWLYANGF